MSGWPTAVRIAWREAKRAKGRAAMVIAMIALPVLALSFVAVGYATFALSPAERAARLMGATQAVVSWDQTNPVQQEPTELNASRVTVNGAPSTEKASPQRLLEMLPAGSELIPDATGHLNVRTATGIGEIATRVLDIADARTTGMLRLLDGRAPRAADEVALTPAAVKRIGTGVGGTLRLADDSRTFRIVGTVENPDNITATTIVMRPDAAPEVAAGASKWLVAMSDPLTWAQIKELNKSGVIAVSRYVLAHPPSSGELYDLDWKTTGGAPTGALVLIAGLAILEIVLLAGPAFAVGARRRRHDLALVAAAGGTPAHVRRIVLADGLVLGTIAALIGLALGIATAAATLPLMERLTNARAGVLRLYPEALAVLAVLAIVTGVLAALVPAWISSRQDVVSALAGRRGITRSRRRWMVLGVALIAGGGIVAGIGAGTVTLPTILIGVTVAEFGLVLCTPAIVGLVARLGHLLPVSPRIALRDASRNRTAAAPAVAAVMAAVAGSLAIGVVVLALQAREKASYYPSGPLGSVTVFEEKGPMDPMSSSTVDSMRAALAQYFPVDHVYTIDVPQCGGSECFVTPRWPADKQCPYSSEVLRRQLTADEQAAARKDPKCKDVSNGYHVEAMIGFPTLIVDDSADQATVMALTLADAAEAERIAGALHAGAVVVDDARYLENGKVTLTVRSGFSKDAPEKGLSAPGYVRTKHHGTTLSIMTASTARSLGLERRTIALLATVSRVPSQEEQDRAQAALSVLSDRIIVDIERGTQPPGTQLLVLAIVAAVVTLVAAALATGLAATDGRADLATLGAVGASPRMRRTLTLSQAGVIAGLGSLLGAIAGLGASTSVLFALNLAYATVWPAPEPLPVAVPWLNVAIAVVVVPLVAMAGSGLLTRSRLPVERRE
jgi:putative ABC transport system permease protein